ncbi:hypothetical protein [Arthrobacter sp. UYCo732]|uniref:hypothetical protein n=1 Tax=Arthrobacter sp. UYCo732 TaxID=3156336 RepID=UPI00339295AA
MRSLPEAVVFAFSGTLNDTSAISYLIAGHHPACDAPGADQFQLESVMCPPVRQIVQLLNVERSIGRRAIIITEARDHYRPHLESWLDLHGIRVDDILLRDIGDHRPDALTKASLLAGLQENVSVIHAYESRADVARAYERLGVPVTRTGIPAVAARRAA